MRGPLVSLALLVCLLDAAMAMDCGGQIKLFGRFDGYSFPRRLKNPIEPKEADTRKAYLKACLSGHTLVWWEKYYNKTVEFRHDYLYYPGGTIMRATITAKEKRTIHEFDRAGRLTVTKYEHL
jgi:hypothetical protein